MTTAEPEPKAVFVAADAYAACTSHALSTEVEEVMGLLIGYCQDNIVYITSLVALVRLDKRPDRVEIGDLDLVKGGVYADELSKKEPPPGGQALTVVGWYHSHPHITIFPSAVDKRTQLMYQQLGPFVGLIFGVYDRKDPMGIDRMKILAFCARRVLSETEHVLLPLRIIPSTSNQLTMKNSCVEAMCAMVKNVFEEERQAFEKATYGTEAGEENGQGDIEPSQLNLWYNGAIYSKHFCKFVAQASLPLLHFLKTRHSDLQKALH